jgi:predicted nucleotidyltransferase component of viral defense system
MVLPDGYDVTTYELEELLATKLRAFYQRRKGRDLFDLSAALVRLSNLDAEKVIRCFQHCMEVNGARVSRAEFEANLAGKLSDPVAADAHVGCFREHGRRLRPHRWTTGRMR